MTNSGFNGEPTPNTPEGMPIPGMPAPDPSVFGAPPADVAPGIADMMPPSFPASLPYAGYTPTPSLPVTSAPPTLSMVSGAVPPSGYWLPPGYPLPPGYVLPPGYAFPPGYALPMLAAPGAIAPEGTGMPYVASAPPSFEVPAPPPPPTKKRRTGRLLAAILIPLALVLVASGTLVVLGTNGVGPLASAVHRPFPTYLHWAGQTSPSGITLAFTVAAKRDKITEMDVTYTNFVCNNGGNTLSINSTKGPDRVFPTSTWPITSGKFVTDEDLSFFVPNGGTIPVRLTMNGQFSSDGNSLSGTWEFDSFVTCNGTFTAIGS